MDVSTLERPAEQAVNLVVASALLALTLPLMVLIAVAIKCECAGPVLVRRRRIRAGRVYTSLKFHTTRDGDPRGPLTRVGRLLLLSHLENLPEIVNVFRGNMSCIRSRPDCPFFLN